MTHDPELASLDQPGGSRPSVNGSACESSAGASAHSWIYRLRSRSGVQTTSNPTHSSGGSVSVALRWFADENASREPKEAVQALHAVAAVISVLNCGSFMAGLYRHQCMSCRLRSLSNTRTGTSANTEVSTPHTARSNYPRGADSLRPVTTRPRIRWQAGPQACQLQSCNAPARKTEPGGAFPKAGTALVLCVDKRVASRPLKNTRTNPLRRSVRLPLTPCPKLPVKKNVVRR